MTKGISMRVRPEQIINGFDVSYYLLANPDVAAAGVDPLGHFQTVGWQERIALDELVFEDRYGQRPLKKVSADCEGHRLSVEGSRSTLVRAGLPAGVPPSRQPRRKSHS